MQNEIYLDNASATRIGRQAMKTMQECLKEVFGNPSSTHAQGQKARTLLQNAREKTARVLNCEPEEIIFTSGGTESNNLAIQGIAQALREKGNHIITSKIEHPSIINTCKHLEKQGFEITYLDVDQYGIVDLKQLQRSIKNNTILVSIMYANNEIGTVQPITEISRITQENKICFHTDACQAPGLLEINVQTLQVDLMTLNGSKISAPKGTGLLYIKKGTKIQPIIHGGGQEHGLRSGTENVPAIASFATALEITGKQRQKQTKKLTGLRDKMIKELTTGMPNTMLNGHPAQRLANNISISIKDADGETIITALSEQGIYVSAGSACTSSKIEQSHVLKAIKMEERYAHGTLRITLSPQTTRKQALTAAEMIKTAIQQSQNRQINKIIMETMQNTK